MTLKLFLIALLCASALADGAYVMSQDSDVALTLDFFTDLYQKYPSFVIIVYQEKPSFKQAYHNARAAGYKNIHVSVDSGVDLSPEDLPAGFKGRVWLKPETLSYPALLSQVESLVNQGFNVGVIDFNKAGEMTRVVPSFVSSLPFAWIVGYYPWAPFAGWECPALTVEYQNWDHERGFIIYSCKLNKDCF